MQEEIRAKIATDLIRDEVRRRVEVVGQVVKTQAQRIGDRVGPKEDVQVVGQVVQTQAQRMICGNL
jgi:hypothetical protein